MKIRTAPWAILILGLIGCATSVGDRAPDWTLRDTAGRSHSFAAYDGQVRVLEFWATWCGPCHAVSPALQAIQERFAGRGVKVLAVHFDDRGDPAAYMRERGFTYTSLLDGREVARAYGVSKIPTIIVVDRRGQVIHRQTGFAAGDENGIVEIIESAL